MSASVPFPSEYIPQTNKNQRPVLFWLGSVVVALAMVTMILGAPLAAATNHGAVAFVLYRSFHTLCHQLPERSFFIAGHQFAVCARCTGLYCGFASVALLYPLLRSLRSTVLPPVKWLFLAAAPLAVDFSLTFLGIWENTHTSRLLTGMLLGGVTVLYVMPGLMELSMRSRGVTSEQKPASRFTMVTREQMASAPSDYSAPERRI